MELIQREEYLARLRQLRGQNLIKVVTGVRRCGKSTLLQLYKAELLTEGVPDERVQFINFEDPKYGYEANWHEIYQRVEAGLVEGETNYVFLDEVQYVPEFERLLVGLQAHEGVDLYVTGSNSHMLSSELATLLSGRSIEIPMLPLSFKEYLAMMKDETVTQDEHFANYLGFGGFPQAVSVFRQGQEAVDAYLAGIYETIAGRDILDRGEVTDKTALNTVTRFLLDNIGKPTSTHNIAEGLKMSDYKVDQMVRALVASFLFYKVGRYDVRGRELLKTQEKYYAVDLGLRWAMLGRDATSDRGRLLENVIYLELKRRGGKVSVGKVGDGEVDFIVRDVEGYTTYYQVTWTMVEEKTRERELTPLKKTADYAPRYVITMDKEEVEYEGIRQVNAIKWLLKG